MLNKEALQEVNCLEKLPEESHFQSQRFHTEVWLRVDGYSRQRQQARRHSLSTVLRCLTVAYKQKRFPCAIAPDIEGLLALGRNRGPAASLLHRLEYLWSSCTGPVSAQSDLYRLTYAIEQLKSQGWVNAAVSDGDWDSEALLVEEYSDTDALLVK